jgi:hypothetical protein
MKFNCLFEKIKIPFLIITLVSLTTSCTEGQVSNNTIPQSPSSKPPNLKKQLVSLNGGDESNIDKLLLQVNRANPENKKLASGLLEDGKKVSEKHKQEGLHGGRSGLSKLFCGSVVNYPTVEALIGCADSLVLADAGFDVKVKRFKSASEIYSTTLKFSERVKSPISPAERKKIEANIKCLDAFVKTSNPKSPGCELIRISFKKP